jgi:hypothetical protein
MSLKQLSQLSVLLRLNMKVYVTIMQVQVSKETP